MDAEKIFNKQAKGVALIIIGSILLLHQLGLLPQNLSFYIIILVALYLIFLGLTKINGIKKIQDMMKKDK